MMKKTILTVSCALILTACGGGGGGGGSDTSPKNPADGSVIQQPANDLSNAKELIQTVNNIVAYYDGFADISERYQQPIQAINGTTSDLIDAADIVITLVRLAQADAGGSNKTYTAKDLEKLLALGGFTQEYNIKNNTLQVVTSANSVKVSGTLKAETFQNFDFDKAQQDNWPDGWFSNPEYAIYGDEMAITVGNFTVEEPVLDQVNTTLNATIGANSILEVQNLANNKKAKLSFSNTSAIAVTYADAMKMDERAAEELPQNAQLKFLNVQFESEGLTAILTEFSAQAKVAKLTDGVASYDQLIPAEIILKGSLDLNDELLQLDAKLNLNNDFNKVYNILVETPDNFMDASVYLKLAGNLKGAQATTKPFVLSVNAKRSELTKGTANIEVAVDKSVLDINLVAQQLNAEPFLSAVIKNKTGASVTIENIDTFTQADIMVNGKSQGKVTKNSTGNYIASFVDNQILVIAP